MKRVNIFKSVMKTVACVSVAVGLLGQQVNAQDLTQLTPDMLEKLKRSSTSGKAFKTPSPVDQARLAQQNGSAAKKASSPKEIEKKLLGMSRIEQDYRARSGLGSLDQYGYDVFNQGNISGYVGANGAALTGRVSGNYVLGIGDEVIIILTGSKEENFTTDIDQEGRVVLPALGPIQAAGRTLSVFQADLKARVEKSFLGTKAHVSMGELKALNIFVLGNVNNPGRYQLNSMASPLEALSMAGGVKKNGSLRTIKIVKDGCAEKNSCQTLDLYALSHQGLGADIGLTDGTRIIVPSLGATVAVVGDVLVPGIFEMPKGATNISHSTLLSYAGGSIRPRGVRYSVQRIGDNGREVLENGSDTNSEILSGDILRVDGISNGLVGHVSLEGEVRVHGQRPLTTYDTVSKLINGTEGLGETPYLPFAILETTDEKTKAKNYKTINLSSIVAGAHDIRLADKDKVIVLGVRDIKFLSSTVLRATILNKQNRSRCEALDHLVDYMSLIGDNRFSAVTRGFAAAEKENIEAEKESNEKQATGGLNDSGLDNSNVVNLGGVSGDFTSNLVGGYGIENEQFFSSNCSPVFERNVNLLPFVLEYVVSVTGSVRNPGVYPVAGEVDLGALLSVAGGLASNADLSLIEVVNENTQMGLTSSTNRRYFDVRKTSMGNINISNRMTVRVPQVITNEESIAVVLSGEFLRPGVYSISKGEKLSDLISRAGGLTQYAYPYGGVMTRLSIARQEQDGYMKAAKNIESALTSASVKSSKISGGAIAAVKGFADELRNAQAIGRLVAELDPAVLSVTPSKDLVLEGGDKIFMPKRPNHILVSGDVLNPGALSFNPDQKVREYIKDAGGVSVSGDGDRVFVVYPNGQAKPVNISRWTYKGSLEIPPGSAIMVPIDLDPFTRLELATTITNLIGQMSITLASIAVLSGN